jgi:hypothetical protein
MAKASHIVVFAYGQPGHRTLGPRGPACCPPAHGKGRNHSSHLEALKGRHSDSSPIPPRIS